MEQNKQCSEEEEAAPDQQLIGRGIADTDYIWVDGKLYVNLYSFLYSN